MADRTVRVDYLARVEGEGSLHLRVRGRRVTEARLEIFEPPRFFEAFLRGRDFREAPDITARICGICPVAYQMSAVQAMEAALGVTVSPEVRALRRLLYCGEWIESHALHVYLLHAPDFLGFPDVAAMAGAGHQAEVERGLQIKKAGNAIVAVVGGREVHPINVRVGGFYRAPSRSEVAALRPALERAAAGALATLRWSAAFAYPDFEPEYTFVALQHPTEYPMYEGVIAASTGLRVPAAAYEAHFEESQVPHSNALHSRLRGTGAYLTGPLARYNLNFDRLRPDVGAAALAAGLGRTCRNPFRSIMVRAVELLQACTDALAIIEDYRLPEPAFVDPLPRAATGHGCTEAPRGILYHRYELAASGAILSAKIVPPTSQNQLRIEADLREFVPDRLDLNKRDLTLACEQLIRSYDPCISCATHFLDLTLETES